MLLKLVRAVEVSPDESTDHDRQQKLHRLERREHQVRLAEPEHVLLALSWPRCKAVGVTIIIMVVVVVVMAME